MSFVTVFLSMFNALFTDPSSMFAIMAGIGVLLGWGIWLIICNFFPQLIPAGK